jgi:hypothetical protein
MMGQAEKRAHKIVMILLITFDDNGFVEAENSQLFRVGLSPLFCRVNMDGWNIC